MATRIHEFPKLTGHLRSHFVTALSDSRTDGDEQVVRPARKSLLHILDRPNCNLLHCPAPAGVNRGDGAVARINHQNRDAIGGLDGDEPSWCFLDQGITVAERARAPAGVDDDIGMDLMKCGQIATTAETVRPTRAETMHQPVEGFERLNAIDVLRIFVEHYAGFWT